MKAFPLNPEVGMNPPGPSWTSALASVAAFPVLMALTAPACGQSIQPEDARIESADVGRFLAVLDDLAQAATAGDSALLLFERYYLEGSAGLRSFVRARIGSALELLDQIRARPSYYGHLRESLRGIEAGEAEIREALAALEEIYPDAVFADVYFVVGRMNSGGTTDADKILIGAEMYGRDEGAPTHELNDWERAVLRDLAALPAIVVHELIHINQAPESGRRTLLAAAVREGSADFLTELLVGKNINEHVHAWANPRERELWEEFRARMRGEDLSGWLYGGDAETDRPADLGYWMGYRIARSFYERAADKKEAFAEILRVSDYEGFLERSEYGESMD